MLKNWRKEQLTKIYVTFPFSSNKWIHFIDILIFDVRNIVIISL